MAYFPTYVGQDAAAVVPVIRRIEVDAIREALEKGVSDFWAMPSHAAFLALVYPLCGMVLAYTPSYQNALQLLFPLASGFALVGPFVAVVFCPSGCNPRTLRNFPIQSTAAEVLHVITILAERRGIAIVAPIHDAIVTESGAADAQELAQVADRLMRDASAVVLKGYELPSDCAILMPGEHFQDKRGAHMWSTITKLLAKLARGVA
jgi:hypothetical protein